MINAKLYGCLLRTIRHHLVRGARAVITLPDHIGGTIPRPTAIRGACKLPSGCCFAAATNIAAPGFNSLFSPGTKETMGTSGGTTIFFSPSLYFTVSTGPSTDVTVCSTLPFVIMLDGCKSQP